MLLIARRPAVPCCWLAAPPLRPAPRLAARRRLALAGSRGISTRCQSSLDGSGSYDSDDLDYSLTRELEGLTQRDKYSKLASHLQLVYDATEKRSKVEPCGTCRGSGEQECNWCHGTGAMTIGDTLYCSNGGCAPCPVCRGTGACKCPKCCGTGKRAAWLASGSW